MKYNGNMSGFGSAKRLQESSKSFTGVPGPGQYTIDPDSHVNGPKHGFGTSTRNHGKAMGDSKYVPGPGQYASMEFVGKEGNKISMKFRPQTASAQSIDIPGPGSYNPNMNAVRHSTPGNTIGSGVRNSLKNDSSMPGPGQFNVGEDWSKQQKGTRFGSSNRLDVARAQGGPGPGQYSLQDRIHAQAPSYSMASRKGSGLTSNLMPGPGQYNPNVSSSKENIGGVKIGTGSRSNLGPGSKEVPGPGSYSM